MCWPSTKFPAYFARPRHTRTPRLVTAIACLFLEDTMNRKNGERENETIVDCWCRAVLILLPVHVHLPPAGIEGARRRDWHVGDSPNLAEDPPRRRQRPVSVLLYPLTSMIGRNQAHGFNYMCSSVFSLVMCCVWGDLFVLFSRRSLQFSS